MTLRKHASILFLVVCLVSVAGHATRPVDPTVLDINVLRITANALRSELRVGETLQLQVEGEFADGSLQDITAEDGTIYDADPEGAVEVSASGLVRGLQRGRVTIRVSFAVGGEEAVEDSLNLLIHDSGDRDGDGLPDDYELEHQLNPDLADDADFDSDEDGLTNLQELPVGTDPRRYDTDGDFQSDGMEVAIGTDPLIPEPFIEGESPLLDDSCVVSALNRSTRVQPNGVWVLPNVPANTGQVRVRASCIKDGITRSGQSDFFTIPPNGTIRVAEIRFDDPEPVPSTLALTAPLTTLTTAGQTVQLTATVNFPDGSSRDVSDAASGTGFISSNPQIATVSASGLVTARVSGTVLVSALHEGALGVLRLQVTLSGDSDGDGLPDDFELANGLDPNNPVDVLDDPDADGLSTRDEFQAALDPFDPDTDNDRLLDGREGEFGTNPLVPDTDGDEVSDGLEVLAGSNPLDPASVNLGPILTAITVQPPSLSLVFNTVLGEASRRLEVKGRLIDGTTIDVRRRSRGTNYSSSALAVASFGAEDGRIFAGQDGAAVVTVTNGSFSATVPVNVTSFSPTALSFLPIPGSANGVDVSGTYAYVVAGAAGLYVVDVSLPEAPRIAGFVDTPGNANDVRVDNGFAYVADGTAGLTVIDVGNPAQPAIAGRRDTPGIATDLAIRGGRVYLADGEAGLAILDVTNPESPFLLGGIDTPGKARGVDSDGSLAVVADSSEGLQVIDVTSPQEPVLLGSTSTAPNFISHAADVVLRGRLAYVTDGADFSLGGLRVIDLQEPSNPVVIGSSSDEFALNGVALDGRLALTADYFFVNAVPIFDIGGPVPSFSAALDLSGEPSRRDDNGNGIAVQNGLVFLAATTGLEDNGTVGDGGLHIGRYRVEEDDLGVAPRVSIVAPAAGSTVPERSPLVVRADATDDFQVASVQFLMDGASVAVDSKAPFEFVVTVPAGRTTFTLGAVAIDYGGNRGEAEPVVAAIGPDNQPRVTLLAPVAGGRVTEGAFIKVAAMATDDVRVDQVELFVDGQLRDVRATPPYRTFVQVPIGAEQLTVQAVATDSVGQTAASELVTVGVDDDPPPLVAVLDPAPGTQLIEGSRVVIGVAATDNLQVTRVRLSANGGLAVDSFEAPYRFPLIVSEGADLVLTVTAEDFIGQQSTIEARFPVVPDPGTTAEGRVIDAGGSGVPGATVNCLGATGSSGSDGSFAVSGVPTLAGRVSCGATVTVGGDLLEGRSAAVPPVVGGQVDLGDVVVAPRILYLGSGNEGSGDSQAGRLLVLDEANQRYVPWSPPLSPAGLSGLTFDSQGRLFGTTPPRPSPPSAIIARKRGQTKAVFNGDGSSLVRFDPDTGAVLTVVPVTEAGGGSGGAVVAAAQKANGFAINVQDLTFDPATNRFFALALDFSRLYTIDPVTGEATGLDSQLSYSRAALALGPDGLLYLLSGQGSSLLLSKIDPASGAVLVSDPVTDTTAGASVGGMTLRPGTGTFLVTTVFGGRALYELDPVSRVIRPFSEPGGVVEGSLLALAFRPLGGSVAVVTTLTGEAVDADGAPVAGAEVTSLGTSGTTGSDGRFELPGVRVRTGTARVAVASGSNLAFSAAVPPVPNGITDVGTIVLGAPVCVTGRLTNFTCARGPVTVPLDLFIEDDLGQQTPVGQVIPDPTGRFCADLRRGRRYVARKEDVECACGALSACEASLSVTDPGASGMCGEPGASCQDLGDVNVQCDFFCGS
jgi:hypothetical protein